MVRREEAGGALTLSAEKGYSRETGNLLFHVALLTALISIAVGRLYSYEGERIVRPGTIAEQGFCANVIAQYDSWSPGRLAEDGDVKPAPVCMGLNSFKAKYNSSGEPLQFAADVSYQDVDGGVVHSTRSPSTIRCASTAIAST